MRANGSAAERACAAEATRLTTHMAATPVYELISADAASAPGRRDGVVAARQPLPCDRVNRYPRRYVFTVVVLVALPGSRFGRFTRASRARTHAGQRPGSYQPGATLGQRPRSTVPQKPKRQRRVSICEIVERRDGPRFQRFGIARPISQPAGLGWYDRRRLWRSQNRWHPTVNTYPRVGAKPWPVTKR